MDEHVKHFDSVDEMMAHIQAEEDAARARAHPAQTSIGRGEYVLRPTEHCLIFGYLFDTNEEGSTRPDLFARGYRTGVWFSEVTPEGEKGDAHVVTLWRILKEEHDAAEAAEWETETIIRSEWGKAMFARIRQEFVNTRGATHDNAGAGFVVAEEDPSS